MENKGVSRNPKKTKFTHIKNNPVKPSGNKSGLCVYCNTMQSQIKRHLKTCKILKYKNNQIDKDKEEETKKLPKKMKETNQLSKKESKKIENSSKFCIPSIGNNLLNENLKLKEELEKIKKEKEILSKENFKLKESLKESTNFMKNLILPPEKKKEIRNLHGFNFNKNLNENQLSLISKYINVSTDLLKSSCSLSEEDKSFIKWINDLNNNI